MVLPLTVLKLMARQPVLVECKTGETFNGTLVHCDTWMNVHLREVTVTSATGDAFYAAPECLVKGSVIKYVRMADDVMQRAIDSNRRHMQKLERDKKNASSAMEQRPSLSGQSPRRPPPHPLPNPANSPSSQFTNSLRRQL
jgi:small nuclear ribonucleoprotein (snRNP)-like protein